MQIPDHELLRLIGRGAYGEVWLARNIIGAYRAVKIVFRRQFEDAKPYEREFSGIQSFERVSRSHQGLVDILQVGQNTRASYFYYVMELADALASEKEAAPGENGGRRGETSRHSASPANTGAANLADYSPRTLCAELRRRERLPVTECAELGLRLTSALEHLHQNGLVHRDVKPSNIIFVKGMPKLADIGLVTDANEANSFVGTAGYIPPEGPGTAQADIYALGKVLYESSMGQDRRAFPELPKDWTLLPQRQQLLELNEILLKACTGDPAQRYKSAEELGRDLELLRRGHSVRRRRILAQAWAIFKIWAAAACLGAAVLGLILFLSGRRKDLVLHSPVPGVEEAVAQGNSKIAAGTPEGLEGGLKDFEEAKKLDATFQPAYVGIFRARLYQEAALPHPSHEIEASLRTAATNLHQVAPSLAEARMAAAYLEWLDGDRSAALEHARQATNERAGSVEGRGWLHAMYGFCLVTSGYSEQAMRQFQIAKHKFPTDPAILQLLGHPYRALHQFDRALECYTNCLNFAPDFWLGHLNKGSTLEEMERFPEAIDELEKCDLAAGDDEHRTKVHYQRLREAFEIGGKAGYWNQKLTNSLSHSPRDAREIASALAHLGRTAEAYGWLRKAYEKDGAKLKGLWWEVCWDHHDKRFQEIASKVGLMQ